MRDVFSAIGGFASPFGSRRGNPAVYLSFIPSGSTGLITANGLVFKVEALPGEWAIEGSMILQSPTPPTQPLVVDDRIEA